MIWCSVFRPTSRLVRVTRGLLILLTGLAIFGTIAVIHRMEATPKFHLDGIVVLRIPFTFFFH